MNSNVEAAWAAGLFDGEGSMVIRAHRKGVQMSMTMADQDVMEHFAAWAGAGVLRYHPPRTPQRQSMWIWQLGCGEDIRRIVTAMLPYLGQRRSARGREILAYLDPDWCKMRRHKISQVGKYSDRNCRGCHWEAESNLRQRRAPAYIRPWIQLPDGFDDEPRRLA